MGSPGAHFGSKLRSTKGLNNIVVFGLGHMHTKQNLLLCEMSTPAGNWVSSSFAMSSANTLDGVMLSSTLFCLFVKNSVIADKVSSVFFIPGVRTGVVAGVDWFAVTNVSLFDVDTTWGLCFCVGIALRVGIDAGWCVG